MNAIATRPLAASIPIAGRSALRPRVTADLRAPRDAVGRARDENGVPRSAWRLAVVPRDPGAPRSVDVGGGSVNARKPRIAHQPSTSAIRTGRAPRRTAVRRARGGDREPPGLPQVGDDQVSARADRREDADCGPRTDVDTGATTSARRRPTSARRACRRPPNGCRRGSSARRTATTPCCRTRSSSCRTRFPPATSPVSSAALIAVPHVDPSGERLMASRVTPSPSASVEMSQVPCRASNATTGSLARSCDAGRNARERETGEEPAPPRRAVVARNGESDVRGRTVEAAADLERRDGRPAEREAVRLDLGLVLRVGDRVGIAREAAADDLAVARDGVGEIGVHDVRARSAAPRRGCRRTRSRAGRCRPGGVVSRPGPPWRKSAPRPPISWSFPASPRMTSARGVPTSTSLPAVPVTTRAPRQLRRAARPTSTTSATRIDVM